MFSKHHGAVSLHKYTVDPTGQVTSGLLRMPEVNFHVQNGPHWSPPTLSSGHLHMLCIQDPRATSSETKNQNVFVNFSKILKITCKVRPITCKESTQEGERYNSALYLISAPDGGRWSAQCPGCFTPWRETRYSLDRMLRGPRSRSGWVQKISPLQGFEPQTVQLVAIPHTDYNKTNNGGGGGD